MEGFIEDFPYAPLYVELDKYAGRFVPWHWHKAVELFYMESGQLEYYTPKHKIIFPEGSGGLVNSNVLHATKNRKGREKNIQLIHMFDLSLIAGVKGGRIDQKYIQPVCQASRLRSCLCSRIIQKSQRSSGESVRHLTFPKTKQGMK